jgi:hypothetical protein
MMRAVVAVMPHRPNSYLPHELSCLMMRAVIAAMAHRACALHPARTRRRRKRRRRRIQSKEGGGDHDTGLGSVTLKIKTQHTHTHRDRRRVNFSSVHSLYVKDTGLRAPTPPHKTPGWLVQDPTTSPSGDLIPGPTIRGSGAHQD